jgi:hypothetical protein
MGTILVSPTISRSCHDLPHYFRARGRERDANEAFYVLDRRLPILMMSRYSNNHRAASQVARGPTGTLPVACTINTAKMAGSELIPSCL